jgi:2-phospho-L-lactate guanylyltransferase
MALAERTAQAIADAGFEPTIVTADDGVIQWARRKRFPLIAEVATKRPAGLDNAARVIAGEALAAGRPWLIVHADLPLISDHDVLQLTAELGAGHIVLSPSYDGGTSALGALEPMPFRYGPLSFHRHLAAAAHRPHRVVWTPGLAFDLDAPADLDAIGRAGRSGWLTDLLPTPPEPGPA